MKTDSGRTHSKIIVTYRLHYKKNGSCWCLLDAWEEEKRTRTGELLGMKASSMKVLTRRIGNERLQAIAETYIREAEFFIICFCRFRSKENMRSNKLRHENTCMEHRNEYKDQL